MIHRTTRNLAGIFAAGILLTGCSSDPAESPASSPSAPPSASAGVDPSAPPSPTSSLSAAEQQAFEEATDVVLAYRQTITDLYSGARTDLNDLNLVAAGELRDKGLTNVQQSLGEGWTSEPSGALLELVWATPISVDLTANPNVVIVSACLDASSVVDVSPDGSRDVGAREKANYEVTRTAYLPDPGWAVTGVRGAASQEDRRC